MPSKDSFQELSFRVFTIVITSIFVLTFYILFAVNTASIRQGSDGNSSFLLAMVLIIIEITLLAMYASVRSMEHAIEKLPSKK